MFQSFRLQQQFAAEDSVLKTVVLEILRRPSIQAIGLKEIAQELTGHYDRIELERCLIVLSEQDLIELAYTSGYSVGFRAVPPRDW